MAKYKLGDIAPIRQGVGPDEFPCWLLNLDMVESDTGRIIEYLYVQSDEIGASTVAFDTRNVLYSKLRPYLNKVVLPDRPGFATSEMLPLMPDTTIITRGYLTHFLRSPRFVGYINEKTSGAKMPRANAADLKATEIDCPTIERQKAIVGMFECLTRIIELYQRQLHVFDTLVKARFVEMFGDPVIDSKHWGQRPLKENLTSIRYGTSIPPAFSNEGYAFIRATNIKNGQIIKEGLKYINQIEAGKIGKCKLSGGEIIIVRSGVNTGDTCVVTDEYIGQYAGYDMILVLNDKTNPVFLNTLINTTYMEKIIKPLTRRAAQPHLNAEQVQSLPILQVPYGLQKQFAFFVSQIDKSKLIIKKSIDKLEVLKQSLMQEYFG